MAKKTNVKEGLAEDTAKVKALKRKTRKVLKDPTKAGEVADELAKGSVDAPESAKDADAEDDAAASDADDVTGGEGEPGGADMAGDMADGLEGGEAEDHPDLCTFLERAIANSKDAITKYTENLEELKAKVKEMGLEVPGLLDPEDVSDEETPEEFPPDAAPEGDGGAEAEGGEEAPPPVEGGEEGGEGVADGDGVADGGEEAAVGDQDAGAAEGNVEAGDAKPIPTKDVESSIAAPAPTSGTKLKK